jgi:REP element-mobilizing transposase RayT
VWEGEAPAEPGNGDESHKLPIRRHPAHRIVETENGPTIIFLTVCTLRRERWLATSENHKALQTVWTDDSCWVVGRYVIMPDHMHLFVSPGKTFVELANWVQYFKSKFTKELGGRAAFPGRWQTDHWDTRMRNAETYGDKWEYVRHNPVRHGLVSRPEDWPFQGQICEIRWD